MSKKLANFKETKFYHFCKQKHLFYLLFAIILYLFQALFYKLSTIINSNGHVIDMEIDKHIPFIKYFFIFYFMYYFMPELILWIISFKDKRKYWRCFISMAIIIVVSNIFYMCFQIQMIREPGYPNDMKLWDIRSLSDFCDVGINFIYNIDGMALNCFPSLHASLGMLAIVSVINFDKKEKYSIWFYLIAIIFGIGCILSTVFIKQHYFIDVIAGISLTIIVTLVVWLIDKYILKQQSKGCELDDN